MAVTTSFSCSGVDVAGFLEYVKANPSRLGDWATTTSGKEDDLFSTWIVEQFEKAKEAGEMPADAVVLGYWGGLTEAGEATNINVAHTFGIDSTDVRDLTRAEIIRGVRHLKPASSFRSRYAYNNILSFQ